MNTPIQHIVMVQGQPVVGAQRVKVKMIINSVVRGNASIEVISAQYSLSAAEVHAALAYYYDNQAEFDHQFEEDAALLRQIGQPADEHLTELRARKSGK